jgi:hypothetical protein
MRKGINGFGIYHKNLLNNQNTQKWSY